MRQRILAAIGALLVTASVAGAQADGPINITANDVSGVCTTAAACATFALNDQPLINVTLDVGGTWTGTLTFQATVNGTDWRTLLAINVATAAPTSTTTAVGTFAIANVGYQAVRARATAAMTGTASVYMRRGYVSARNLAPTSLLLGDGTAGAPSLSFASRPTSGIFLGGGTVPSWSYNGTEYGSFYSDLILRSTSSVSWASGAPSTTSQDTFLTRSAAGKVALTGTTPMLQLGGTTNTFPALKRNATGIDARLADDSAFAGFTAQAVTAAAGYYLQSGAVLMTSATNPTISAGFGTSPSLVSANGTAAFIINVGTGGTANTGTIGMPAAANNWVCAVNNITAAGAHVPYNTRQVSSSATTVVVENQTTSTGAVVAWAASNIIALSCFSY